MISHLFLRFQPTKAILEEWKEIVQRFENNKGYEKTFEAFFDHPEFERCTSHLSDDQLKQLEKHVGKTNGL